MNCSNQIDWKLDASPITRPVFSSGRFETRPFSTGAPIKQEQRVLKKSHRPEVLHAVQTSPGKSPEVSNRKNRRCRRSEALPRLC